MITLPADPAASPTGPAPSSAFGLRRQLLGVFGLVLTLTVLIVSVATAGLLQLKDALQRQMFEEGAMTMLAQQAAISTLQLRRFEKDAFLNLADAAARDDYLAQWRSANQLLREDLARFAALATTPEDLRLVEDWETARADYEQGMSAVSAALLDGRLGTPERANEALAPYKASIRALTDTAIDSAAEKRQRAEAAVRALSASTDQTIALLGGSAVIVLVLSGGAGLWFTRRLMHGLGALSQGASRLAAGELTTRIALAQADELGLVAGQLNAMAAHIQRQMGELEQATGTARQLQEQEAEARRRLELAVADYLAFVQAVAAGDLSGRLDAGYGGTLDQLGQGLNRMAAELDTAQVAARQLQEQEVEARRRLEQAVAGYLTFIQAVAAGDLTPRLEVGQDDTLGLLGAGLNSMVESLQSITLQVQQASSNIAAMAAEILAATTQQAAGAAEQSAAITQTTTTIEEVKAIAAQTAEQASTVAHASQGALLVARSGTVAVEQTVAGMGQISQRVEGIAETILALSEQTQAIGTIIQTVSELADQSNLLALNAAIEAARAGEQGKSFAVVAQHVRDLAERSKDATGQVREILSEIQHATNAAVMVTEEGTKGVAVGAEQARQTGQVIQRITGDVESGAQANVQMAAAAQQQTAGMEQIGQAMQAIQQATSQTLASTRQAERAAHDLNALAQTLQRVVARYRV